MRYELRELQDGFEILPALAKSNKKKSFIESGFEINESELNSNLFDFQKYVVKTALSKGRFAIFADCGLGKTLMQLSWSEAVFNHTNKKVLILAPLAVVE